MKIEIWSDYVCPFCYIGKRELELALQATGLTKQAQVEMKAYQLDPTAAPTSDITMYEALAKKFNTTIEQAKAQTNGVAQRAKEVGLNYAFDKMRPANTFKAHRLVEFAKTHAKEKEMTERLLKAYFEEGQEIGLEDVLIFLAKEVGLAEAETKLALADEQYATSVLLDMQEAQQIGVQGVPFFVFNRKYAISGAQPREAFEQALRKVAEEEGIQQGFEMLGDDASSCEDDHCKL